MVATCTYILGVWMLKSKVVEYIQNHSDSDFTHSICPQYAEKLYP